MLSRASLTLLVMTLFIFLAGVAEHGALAQEQKPAAEQGGVTNAQYRLSVGDKLHIVVFGQDDVSGDFQIDGAGNITMPLLGQVAAANRTVNQLQTDITAVLDRDYIVNPRVSIEVLNYRPFYILGQVASPGSYPYVSGMDVRQAIAIAWRIYAARADLDGHGDPAVRARHRARHRQNRNDTRRTGFSRRYHRGSAPALLRT